MKKFGKNGQIAACWFHRFMESSAVEDSIEEWVAEGTKSGWKAGVNGCWQSRRIGGSNRFTAVVILQFGRRKEKFQGDRNWVRVPVEVRTEKLRMHCKLVLSIAHEGEAIGWCTVKIGVRSRTTSLGWVLVGKFCSTKGTGSFRKPYT